MKHFTDFEQLTLSTYSSMKKGRSNSADLPFFDKFMLI
ncbi:fatty acid beta hydroxylase [Enterococcus lactis]|nr:fatty acid beta hydroxylase [Enterococcus lactis]MBL5011285.1 fatty acid beta hydroxylase [Enterococcus lactis]